ncbi:hypothetical protein [Spartinivicinus poritis]|uniref:Uncharacterized protein n=1 Tax=Spartinivicinus poritis TaxID=2994640 RepID=A0ABT5U984_9GAMM|nr:hypothetical protein [Spartinivicinus sp. A2-2]MDE1462117.1 hypothetical protein [Spartinivicinus sp. A2-2]
MYTQLESLKQTGQNNLLQKKKPIQLKKFASASNHILTESNIYGLLKTDTTRLYATSTAAHPKPESRFAKTNSDFEDLKVKYKNSDSMNKMKTYGTDCGSYARSLMISNKNDGSVPKDPNPWSNIAIKTRERLIGEVATPAVGHAYYIKFGDNGPNLQKREYVQSPWDMNERVEKGKTNFHVAAVVAKDKGSMITSEVNAAFKKQTSAWFQIYQGKQTFYKTFQAEYETEINGKKIPPKVYEYDAKG